MPGLPDLPSRLTLVETLLRIKRVHEGTCAAVKGLAKRGVHVETADIDSLRHAAPLCNCWLSRP